MFRIATRAVLDMMAMRGDCTLLGCHGPQQSCLPLQLLLLLLLRAHLLLLLLLRSAGVFG
jgi:hypothetical protein